MYPIETPQVSTELLNQNFFEMLERGQTEKVAEAGTPLVRVLVRQASAAREIITPEPIGPSDLSEWPDADQPMKFMDIEPNSVATAVQFYGTPKSRFYFQRKVPVFFTKLQSDEFTKNIFELMTYRNDVRKLFADNATFDVADQEDVGFRRQCLLGVNRNPVVQRTSVPKLTATAWAKGLKAVYDRRLMVGKGLMSKSRHVDMIDLPATVVGDSIAKEHYQDGIEKESGLWGIPLVTTLKSDIYLPDEAWLFPPTAYMGKFWVLRDATLYVEQKADWIKFYVYAYLGIGLANTVGIQQIIFNAPPVSN